MKNKNLMLLDKIDSFIPDQIFNCGQCFRWEKENDSYLGVVGDKVIELKEIELNRYIINGSKNIDREFITSYFDINRNYIRIKEMLSKDSKYLLSACEFGKGIRILNQDIWECLISFIISSNNNIPRIKKILNSLCKEFGTTITYKGNTFYSFPLPEEIKCLSHDELSFCRSGYRAKYIFDAVNKVKCKIVDLDKLKNLNTEEARCELIKIKGIGPKVADCILLFSLGRFEVFPIDVWIKRTVENLYFNGRDVSINKILEFSKERFGVIAGFAQQYLYYWSRENSKECLFC